MPMAPGGGGVGQRPYMMAPGMVPMAAGGPAAALQQPRMMMAPNVGIAGYRMPMAGREGVEGGGSVGGKETALVRPAHSLPYLLTHSRRRCGVRQQGPAGPAGARRH